MSALRQLIGRFRLRWRGTNHIVGWSMTPEQAVSFIRSRAKLVLTFYGYSGIGYEDEAAMLQVARDVLCQYRPEKTLVVIGATRVGIGAVYPLAKSMGFEAAGIVSSKALRRPEGISPMVDHLCFIKDEQYGGKLPDSDQLSPTSQAMVACSDLLVAIGGGDISRDELQAGRRQGKPIQYFPAEMNHERALHYAQSRGRPAPASFWGNVHDEFGE